MKFLKNKAGKAALIIVVCMILLAIISTILGINPVSSVVRTVFAPFQSGFSYVVNKIEGSINFIYEMKGYKAENERLVSENTALKKEIRDSEHYRKQIEELQSILNLKNSISGYECVAAEVIGYSLNSHYDKIELNKGTVHGVAVGDTVMTADGLVGLVTETGLNHSIVTTVISGGNAIGVTISRTGDLGVIEGDSELCLNSQCKLTFVDKGVSIMQGDILVTSGSGSVYPEGISVGIIRDINMDNLGMLNYAVVDTVVDFAHMHEVLILKTNKEAAQ